MRQVGCVVGVRGRESSPLTAKGDHLTESTLHRQDWHCSKRRLFSVEAAQGRIKPKGFLSQLPEGSLIFAVTVKGGKSLSERGLIWTAC